VKLLTASKSYIIAFVPTQRERGWAPERGLGRRWGMEGWGRRERGREGHLLGQAV
jgi:hypothetical protein